MKEKNDKYKPALTKAVFTFYQEGNCMDGGDEELEIRCESSTLRLGEDCFFVLKTEQWAFDSVEELEELVSKIKQSINNK